MSRDGRIKATINNGQLKELKDLKEKTKTVSVTFQCPSWVENEITELSNILETKRSETIRLILENYFKNQPIKE